MFKSIVILLCILTVINAIDPHANTRSRSHLSPRSPNAIDPLNGCTMIGITDDPATSLKGINIMAIDISGTCYSPDNKFVVPCNLIIEPLIVTSVQINSSSHTSTTDYTYDSTSRVSFEANGGFGPFTVNARFTESSSDYVHTIYSDSVTYVSTMAEMQLYQITAPFLSMPLSSEFTDYINILADKYEANDPTGFNYWRSLFIQNVPIGVITRIITGGRLQQTQFVEDTYYQSTDKNVVEGCASFTADFAGMFSAGGQYSWGVTTEEIQTFLGKVSQVTTTAIGGPYISGMTLAQWQTAVEQTPGILAYWLSSTATFIDPQFFPQRNASTIQYVRSAYENPWVSYLNNNSKLGCTDKFAINFQLEATVDDGSCAHVYATTSSFAGIYMKEVVTNNGNVNTAYFNNPLTGLPSCPSGAFENCVTAESSANWQGFSNQVDLTVCTCSGNSGPSFGGVYSVGTTIDDYVSINGANNVVTGITNCANGTTAHAISGINICTGNNVMSWTYGGSYYYVGNGCNPNPVTDQCSCPDDSYATVSIGFNVQSQWNPFPTTGTINLCVTLPSQQTNSNPGSLPNYVAMTVSNVTWVPTQPPTPSVSSIPTIPPPTSPSNPVYPPVWTYPVILGIAIVVILGGVMATIYFRCRNKGEYEPV